MGQAEQEIRDAWRTVAGSAHDGICDELLTRHAEPHRRYHTADHVMWVLRHVRALLASGAAGDADADAIVAAALFHDAIYDPTSPTNEADSAVLAVERLGELGWARHRLDVVAELIVATAGHDATTAEAGVLLDADLAVLGSDADAYAAYVAGVRFEYAHVPDARWRAGRGEVLRSFLDRPRIYATAAMFAAREATARRNLSAELDALTDSALRDSGSDPDADRSCE